MNKIQLVIFSLPEVISLFPHKMLTCLQVHVLLIHEIYVSTASLKLLTIHSWAQYSFKSLFFSDSRIHFKLKTVIISFSTQTHEPILSIVTKKRYEKKWNSPWKLAQLDMWACRKMAGEWLAWILIPHLLEDLHYFIPTSPLVNNVVMLVYGNE